MSAFDRVVVGIDLRSGGQDALALARALAPDARLVLAHVFTYGTTEAMAELTGWDDACRTGALDMLAAERQTAGVDAELEVVADRSAARALQAIATRRAADLIVIGSAHHGRFGRILLGDVGRSLVQDAPCPVAVAPRAFAGEAPTAIGVGFDGSPESRAALALAAEVARATGARLEVLTVVSPPSWTTPTLYDWPGRMNDERQLADELVAEATGQVPGAGGAVLEGLPADELARCSARLGLLVVGSRRWGPARRVLLGSTSDRLAHTAACPLLVTPRAAVTESAATAPAHAVAATPEAG